MTRFCALAIFLMMLAVEGALDAQTTIPARQTASISASLSLRVDKAPTGPKPWAIVTVKNLGNQDVSLGTVMRDYRVHVEGDKGELPKTSYHRSVRGEFQPGDKYLADGGPVDSVPPGGSNIHKFDLTYFYDLKAPGKYTVYIEVLDELTNIWVRTNIVKFTI